MPFEDSESDEMDLEESLDRSSCLSSSLRIAGPTNPVTT